jgi:hypothetical protein
MFRPIGQKELALELEQSLAPKVKSDRTKALEMYNQKRTPFEVATELDIPPEDARRYKREYWKLKGIADLEEVYQDTNGSIGPLINLHYELNARGTTVNQVFVELKKLDSVLQLKRKKTNHH